MPEFALYIGGGTDPASHMDGDVLQGFNSRFIGQKNAECLCFGLNGHPKPSRRDGLLSRDTITEAWYEITHQYRFRRVLDVVEREVLATGEKTTHTGPEYAVSIDGGPERVVLWSELKARVEASRQDKTPLTDDSRGALQIVAGDIGNAVLTRNPDTRRWNLTIDGEARTFSVRLLTFEFMRVEQDIAVRYQAGFPMFGARGSEIWYGGRKDFSGPKIDALWQRIEAKSAHRRVDHLQFPVGPKNRSEFLFLPVDDFDDAVAKAIQTPETEEIDDPVKPGRKTTRIVRRHTMRVDYPALDLSPVTLRDIRDKTVDIDVRDREPFLRAQIVRTR